MSTRQDNPDETQREALRNYYRQHAQLSNQMREGLNTTISGERARLRMDHPPSGSTTLPTIPSRTVQVEGTSSFPVEHQITPRYQESMQDILGGFQQILSQIGTVSVASSSSSSHPSSGSEYHREHYISFMKKVANPNLPISPDRVTTKAELCHASVKNDKWYFVNAGHGDPDWGRRFCFQMADICGEEHVCGRDCRRTMLDLPNDEKVWKLFLGTIPSVEEPLKVNICAYVELCSGEFGGILPMFYHYVKDFVHLFPTHAATYGRVYDRLPASSSWPTAMSAEERFTTFKKRFTFLIFAAAVAYTKNEMYEPALGLLEFCSSRSSQLLRANILQELGKYKEAFEIYDTFPVDMVASGIVECAINTENNDVAITTLLIALPTFCWGVKVAGFVLGLNSQGVAKDLRKHAIAYLASINASDPSFAKQLLGLSKSIELDGFGKEVCMWASPQFPGESIFQWAPLLRDENHDYGIHTLDALKRKFPSCPNVDVFYTLAECLVENRRIDILEIVQRMASGEFEDLLCEWIVQSCAHWMTPVELSICADSILLKLVTPVSRHTLLFCLYLWGLLEEAPYERWPEFKDGGLYDSMATILYAQFQAFTGEGELPKETLNYFRLKEYDMFAGTLAGLEMQIRWADRDRDAMRQYAMYANTKDVVFFGENPMVEMWLEDGKVATALATAEKYGKPSSFMQEEQVARVLMHQGLYAKAYQLVCRLFGQAFSPRFVDWMVECMMNLSLYSTLLEFVSRYDVRRLGTRYAKEIVYALYKEGRYMEMHGWLVCSRLRPNVVQVGTVLLIEALWNARELNYPHNVIDNICDLLNPYADCHWGRNNFLLNEAPQALLYYTEKKLKLSGRGAHLEPVVRVLKRTAKQAEIEAEVRTKYYEEFAMDVYGYKKVRIDEDGNAVAVPLEKYEPAPRSKLARVKDDARVSDDVQWEDVCYCCQDVLPLTSVFSPCGHRICNGPECAKRSSEFISAGARCGICREKIDKIIKIR